MSRAARPVVSILLALGLGVAASGRASAGVDITVDAATLTDLLAAMVPASVALDLPADNRVTLHLEDVRVTGFDPAAAEGGQILTSVRLESSELGVSMTLAPRLSLHLEEIDGRSVCHLRFDKVVLPVPLGAPLDVARLLPRIPVPADESNTVETARGLFTVRTRLTATEIGASAVRFHFDLEVSPFAPATTPP